MSAPRRRATSSHTCRRRAGRRCCGRPSRSRVGAPSPEELEQRVEMVRRAYGEVRLHRPLGRPAASVHSAHARSAEHGCRLRGHVHDRTGRGDDADRHPRGRRAPRVLSGAHPVRLPQAGALQPPRRLRARTETRRSSASGRSESGKTTLAQKLQYEAFLQGARVIDCDPKGDHRFHLLEDVAPHVECVTLAPDPALRGMLDPLRVAPPQLRQDAAVSFLQRPPAGTRQPRHGRRRS